MYLRVLCVCCFLGSWSCRHAERKDLSEAKLSDTTYVVLPDEVINTITVCTEMNASPDSIKTGRKQASGKRWLFWEKSRKQLFVTFTDGDSIVQEKVKQVAKEWEKYCGKELVFLDPRKPAAEPDITVSFKEKNSWSLVGKDSRSSVPSMNLGWLTPTTDDQEYQRVVLHEFGHALGLVHEHQNPNNNPIQWNKENVYAFYKQKFGWSKQVTYANFFEKYSVNQMNSSSFDSLSIMMYEIPALFTADGFHKNANTQLSETDKAWIGRIYPKEQP